MIKSFVHKGLGNYFYTGVKKGIQAKHAQKLADILDRLEASGDVRDMNTLVLTYISLKVK